MSTAISSHYSGAGPLSLMSCVRESSPPQDGGSDYEIEKHVTSKKRFWNPRKWFKRKCNKVSEEVQSPNDVLEPKETLRSRSTSELSVSEDHTRRRSGTPMHPGLSVSHDSVFHSPQSGSELELDAAQSSSSLSISHQPTQQDIRLQTELGERLRLRRIRGYTSEDDEGLPRSPCNSPTTADSIMDKSHIKDHTTKSHSTCSDGSLLSMGSSEMEEDSFGLHSRNSSKLSLHDKRTSDTTDEDEVEWGPSNSSIPLNHSAAHHKVSIRPKRTHGAPNRRKRVGAVQISALPTTPEVNEDTSIRSVTPELSSKEIKNELYTSISHPSPQLSKIKCSSLPPGLTGPGASGSKLSRSRSNAGTKNEDLFATLEEEYVEEKKSETSFFGRIFPRRSGKKKKTKEESLSSVNIAYESYEPFEGLDMITVDNNLAIRPNALRTGPSSRQRMTPIDIPVQPKFDSTRNSSSFHIIEIDRQNKNKSSTLLNVSSSPLQFSLSPPKSPWNVTKLSNAKYESTREESKSKVRIAGLSSLQQRVLSLNDDDTDTSFKSLTNLPTETEIMTKPIAKSHSFKTTKQTYETKDVRNISTSITNIKTQEIYHETCSNNTNIYKSISLDSVQNPDETVVESINKTKVENEITISGPSHKAIVNIGTTVSSNNTLNKIEEIVKEQVTVTKIHVKRENTQIQITDNSHSENYNDYQAIHESKELRKNSLTEKQRKFSNDNIEFVRKEDTEETKPSIGRYFKKHSESPKKTEKPFLKTKSNSFEANETKTSIISKKQNSEEKLETKSQENLSENVIMRRKSLVRYKQEEEPELMKVFARRSLKIKDSDSENLSQQVLSMIQDNSNKSRDSDKENFSDSSPLEERKKIAPDLKAKDSESKFIKEKDSKHIKDTDNKILVKEQKMITENNSETKIIKEKHSETKIIKEKNVKEQKIIETSEVTFRKPMTNSKVNVFQRTVSLNQPKVEIKVLKQISVVERPKTESWFLNKNQDDKIITNNEDEIINNVAEKNEVNIKPKNFNQRKAEWEKRAQEALRKTVP